MATDDKAVDKSAADDGEHDSTGAPIVNHGALGMAKTIEAWRGASGDDAVDEALSIEADRRKARDKAEAGERRRAGTSSSSAPAGRSSAADSKSKA